MPDHKGYEFRALTTGKGRDRYPTVLRQAGGIVLHVSTSDPKFRTVSHAFTGYALFDDATLWEAEEFFREASQWPEWESIKSKSDCQFIRGRVMELIRSVREN